MEALGLVGLPIDAHREYLALQESLLVDVFVKRDEGHGFFSEFCAIL